MAYRSQRFGWLRDIPDQRDHLYAAPPVALAALPPMVDLRSQCPPIYDQGQLASCTANAVAAALQFERMKQGLSQNFVPSRLFIYYNERVIEHTVSSDGGAMIRNGIKSVAKQGDCPETDWPYDITKFAVKPPLITYREAVHYSAVQYQRLVQSVSQMKGCLASGHPFVFGFSVHESFESAQVATTGVVSNPGMAETLIGGHSGVAVGYDDGQQRFIVRNSWGTAWGFEGYCTMPYAYLMDSNLASDFWTIRLMAA